MAEALCGSEDRWVRLDVSRPVCASPLALAAVAGERNAVIAADIYRHDLNGVVPEDLPWITWATRPRFAPPVCDGTRDGVLIADEKWRTLATAAGWKSDRINIADWPALAWPPSAANDAPIAMIADAIRIDMPEKLKDFSSHGMLWERILAELQADPLTIGDDAEAFLMSRARQMEIDWAAIDRQMFMTKLILPAWRRAVVRTLHAAKLPVVIYGSGWEEEEFSPLRRGTIATLPELGRAAAASAALIHPDPSGGVHPVAALGRPVARPRRLLIEGRRAVRISPNPPQRLSPQVVLSILR
jgi:hypothetical protein